VVVLEHEVDHELLTDLVHEGQGVGTHELEDGREEIEGEFVVEHVGLRSYLDHLYESRLDSNEVPQVIEGEVPSAAISTYDVEGVDKLSEDLEADLWLRLNSAGFQEV